MQSSAPSWNIAGNRRTLYVALAFSAALTITMLLLPGIFHVDWNNMLAPTSWLERTTAEGALTGHYHHAFETPRPLWDLFWMLIPYPAFYYPLLALLVGTFSLLLILVSGQVFKSAIPGMLGSLLFIFCFPENLTNFMTGGWNIAFLVLALLALYCYQRNQTVRFVIVLLFAGLIRPESWMIAGYVLLLHVFRKRFKPVLLVPLLAPVLWAVYDWRLSGNPLFSYRATHDYAWFSGLIPTSFLAYWPTIVREFKDQSGIPLLLLGVAGMIYWLVTRRERNLLLNPILIFTFVPLLFSWLTTLKGDIYVMGRFFPVSLLLLTISTFFIPYSLPPRKRRTTFYVFLLLPVLLGAIQAPFVFRETPKSLATRARTAVISEDDAGYLKTVDISKYRRIFIPVRQYATFYQLLGDRYYDKLVGYRELNRMATSGKDFAAMLPALAVWITGDELGFPQIFSELYKGKTVSVTLEGENLRFDFVLLHQTAEEGGYIYEVTSGPAEVR
jgi:hypothetical protein